MYTSSLAQFERWTWIILRQCPIPTILVVGVLPLTFHDGQFSGGPLESTRREALFLCSLIHVLPYCAPLVLHMAASVSSTEATVLM
jgi:hypothetical protein